MKIFKKIRLWIIKKLNAIPKEEKICMVARYEVPFVELHAKETISYPCVEIEEYQDYVKKSIATQIGLGLLEKGLIEFEYEENLMYYNKTIYGRVRVAIPLERRDT